MLINYFQNKDTDILKPQKDSAEKERLNNIFINVFGYEKKTLYCIYTFKQKFEKYVDFLLLSNSKNSHFVQNKYLIDLCPVKQNISIKNIFVDIAYNYFINQQHQNIM